MKESIVKNNTLRLAAKIDLHCHLDGSVPVWLLQKEMLRRGRDFTQEELERAVVAPARPENLGDYLSRFDLPLECVKNPDFLREAARELAVHAREENVLYLEVRFAPASCLGEGMTSGDAMDAVLKGLAQAEAETGIFTGLICCGMRHFPEEKNLTMLKEARERLGAGVVACDLAGDEAGLPNGLFGTFFAECRRLGLPMTIHAGECHSPASVRAAIEMGAHRLGHGIAMAQDPALRKLCAERHVGVELCPTSNLQTGACSGWGAYPLRIFLQEGIPLSINTDNRTVSHTDSTRELEVLTRELELTEEEYFKIYQDSVEMAFADDGIKQKLLSSGRGLA